MDPALEAGESFQFEFLECKVVDVSARLGALKALPVLFVKDGQRCQSSSGGRCPNQQTSSEQSNRVVPYPCRSDSFRLTAIRLRESVSGVWYA